MGLITPSIMCVLGVIRVETQAKDAPGFRYEDYMDEYDEYEEGEYEESYEEGYEDGEPADEPLE